MLTGITWTGQSSDHSSIAIIYQQFMALAGGEYAQFLRTHADTAAVKKIDTVLGGIIDPQQTVFDMDKLAAGFGYPREDYEGWYLDERINEKF